jgi:hypothetical protein
VPDQVDEDFNHLIGKPTEADANRGTFVDQYESKYNALFKEEEEAERKREEERERQK